MGTREYKKTNIVLDYNNKGGVDNLNKVCYFYFASLSTFGLVNAH